MAKLKTMAKQNRWALGLSVVALVLVVGGLFGLFGDLGLGSVTEPGVDPLTGEPVDDWAKLSVPIDLTVENEFTGAGVTATVKAYSEEPSDWENARGDFEDAENYELYNVNSSSQTATINDFKSGEMIYVVIEASGYNTFFETYQIPTSLDFPRTTLTDYRGNPQPLKAKISAVGSTTDEDFDFTLVNDTVVELDDALLLKVADDTKFKGWKVIVTDEEGFSVDTDGDGTFDEGIDMLKVTVGGISATVFDVDTSTNEFNNEDEYTFFIDNPQVVAADGDNLQVSVDIEAAATGDYTGANDEVWGEGEGVLGYIKIYDAEGNLFATVDISA